MAASKRVNASGSFQLTGMINERVFGGVLWYAVIVEIEWEVDVVGKEELLWKSVWDCQSIGLLEMREM